MKTLAIDGMQKFDGVMKQLIDKYASDNEDVIVGYTQNYAVYVHEDMKARHKEGKTAKYLEKAVKIVQPLINGILLQVMNAGKSITQGMLLVGLRIQRESMMIVPIDTGALRASAFTARDSQAASAASTAQARSESLKNKAKDKRKAKSEKAAKKKGKK